MSYNQFRIIVLVAIAGAAIVEEVVRARRLKVLEEERRFKNAILIN